MRTLIALAVLTLFVGAAAAQTTERGTTTSPITKKSDDDDGTPKLSLPTEADRVAWQRSGFRLGLGLVYGRFEGLRGAPSGRLLGAQRSARAAARCRLVAAHVVPVRVGVGAERRALRPAVRRHARSDVARDAELLARDRRRLRRHRRGRGPDASIRFRRETDTTLHVSRTRTCRSQSCSGVGVAGLARAEYAWVLGPRAQTSVVARGRSASTRGASSDSGAVEPDTGAADRAPPVLGALSASHSRGASRGAEASSSSSRCCAPSRSRSAPPMRGRRRRRRADRRGTGATELSSAGREGLDRRRISGSARRRSRRPSRSPSSCSSTRPARSRRSIWSPRRSRSSTTR